MRELEFFIELFGEVGKRIRLAKANPEALRQQVFYKEKGEIVTAIDRAIEELIHARINKYFAGDTIVAEESYQSNRKRGITCRVWYVDPIDGTKSFVEQASGFSVMVGSTVEGKPHQGFVYDPIRQVLYCAWTEGRVVAYHESTGRIEEISTTTPSSRRLIWNPYNKSTLRGTLMSRLQLDSLLEIESTGLRAIALLQGEGALFTSSGITSNVWDTCAAHALVIASGGYYTNFLGESLSYCAEKPVRKCGSIASRGIDHEEACRLLAAEFEGDLRASCNS